MNLSGKRGVVLGVLNKKSMAAACASRLMSAGAEVICSYLPVKGDEERRHILATRAVILRLTSRAASCPARPVANVVRLPHEPIEYPTVSVSPTSIFTGDWVSKKLSKVLSTWFSMSLVLYNNTRKSTIKNTNPERINRGILYLFFIFLNSAKN